MKGAGRIDDPVLVLSEAVLVLVIERRGGPGRSVREDQRRPSTSASTSTSTEMRGRVTRAQTSRIE